MVMDTTMYEDGGFNSYSKECIAQTKRKLTLDLSKANVKKQRLTINGFNPLLTSPDLNRIKLSSPELDRLILQQHGLIPTGTTPQLVFPRVPTQEQEQFARGFEESLEQLHNQSTDGTLKYTQLEPPQSNQMVKMKEDYVTEIKEEPQLVPSGTPPLSPIDLETQEQKKLERKRLRNRIAASKCRRRKLERINRLEDKVTCLKNENSELQVLANRLRDQVCELKKEVMEHVHSGCQIPFVTHQ